MNCLYIHSSNIHINESEKIKLYERLINCINTYNIKHVFWSNDSYNFNNYTSTIQMLMKEPKYGFLLFTCIIDNNDYFNDVLNSFVKRHTLQLSIFLKNINTHYTHILKRNHGYHVYEFEHI